jgi:hypothetical protein
MVIKAGAVFAQARCDWAREKTLAENLEKEQKARERGNLRDAFCSSCQTILGLDHIEVFNAATFSLEPELDDDEVERTGCILEDYSGEQIKLVFNGPTLSRDVSLIVMRRCGGEGCDNWIPAGGITKGEGLGALGRMLELPVGLCGQCRE